MLVSGDDEVLDIIHALRPSEDLAVQLGPGAVNRELGQPLAASGMPDPSLRGVSLAQEEVRLNLRKARKMRVGQTQSIRLSSPKELQDANAPSHLVLPFVLSSIELSAELGIWPMYRSGIILLTEVLVDMTGQHMAAAAIREVENIWDQVGPPLESSLPSLGRSRLQLCHGSDEEDIARAALVWGKANIELALSQEDSSAESPQAYFGEDTLLQQETFS